MSEGLKTVGWTGMEIIHAYDVDTELIPALVAQYGPEFVQRFNIGPAAICYILTWAKWRMWT